MIELYGNLQWPRMIQLLNPVVSQPLYPATFCKATEQCTTVSKVAFTRELYPKASCGELEEREREEQLTNVTVKPWLRQAVSQLSWSMASSQAQVSFQLSLS